MHLHIPQVVFLRKALNELVFMLPNPSFKIAGYPSIERCVIFVA